MFKKLSDYLVEDTEKRQVINDLLFPKSEYKLSSPFKSRELILSELNMCECDVIALTKYCPQCHREYREVENFCLDCAVKLKRISDIISVRDIKTHPHFIFNGSNSFREFEDIFTPENIETVNAYKLKVKDYKGIVNDIKKAAFLEFDGLVKSNDLVLDYLDITDKVLLFSKSFVEVDYKSFGQELGTFSFDRIEIDDRQTSSLQITTLIHELSHFLLKEMLSVVLCMILDCEKNSFIDAISTFILTYSPINRLIDEYSAHSAEGRFTVYGYQDYSSFIQIQKSLEGEIPAEEINIAMAIGNTFSIYIKGILEAYIDDDLRREIKDLFLMQNREAPNYEMLALENCNSLKNRGFMQAICLILSEGFEVASLNVEKLKRYEKNF